MEIKQKATFLCMAAAMCDVGIEEKTAILLIKLNDEVEKKGDQFSIRDAAIIKVEVMKMYEPKKPVPKRKLRPTQMP